VAEVSISIIEVPFASQILGTIPKRSQDWAVLVGVP
jgi:hypothetical protein